MSNSFYHNTLSNNTCDIESNLMGINSSNLVQKKSEFQPRLNTLPFKPFFELPNRFIPEPMVVNNKQRPAGPFTNN